MSDESKGTAGEGAATATTDPATTGTSTAGEGTAAPAADSVTLTKAELDARDARVRKATEASIREKLKRDADASQMSAEEKAKTFEARATDAETKLAIAEHKVGLLTAASRLGFTSTPYLNTALEAAIKANPEAVDYEAVAKAAIAAATADGLAPKSAATTTTAGAPDGTAADSPVSPNQNGAASKKTDDALASMTETEMLARARKDPEWRKAVLEPYLDRKGQLQRQGHKG